MDTPTTATSQPRRSYARLWAFAVVVLLALHAGQARAITWLCSLTDDGTALVCMADVDARENSDAVSNAAATTTAVVNGTAFPLHPSRVYTVSLWAPPTEAEFVHLLARATICYRSPGCTVLLAPSAWLDDATVRAPTTRAGQPRPKSAAPS
jgi:hypothetical protein